MKGFIVYLIASINKVGKELELDASNVIKDTRKCMIKVDTDTDCKNNTDSVGQKNKTIA